MMNHADSTIKSDDEGDHEEGKSDYAERFAPCQTCDRR